MTDVADDILDQHPYGDMLLEDFYKNQIEKLKAEIEFLEDDNECLRDDLWEAKKTVTNETDARAWVIIELMTVEGKPGDSLDAPRIASILRKCDKPELRLPDVKDNSKQVVRVVKRIPELDSRFRIEKVGHGKKVWRTIRDY